MTKPATIGPLMEQLVQLVTDVDLLKKQMAAILPGYAEATRLAKPRGYRRRTPEEIAEANAAAAADPTPRRTRKMTPASRAAAALNGRIRHLDVSDPLRIKTLEIRARKGHAAALDFINKKLPAGRGVRERREARLALAAKRSGQRPDNALRSQFVAAIRNLSNADRSEANKQRKEHGTHAALRWIESRKAATTSNTEE